MGGSRNGRATLGRPVSPSVRLSPKASNLAASSAKPVSVTVKVQEACRDCASLAAQFTVVLPREKVAPDAGVQIVAVGAAPPVTVGAG